MREEGACAGLTASVKRHADCENRKRRGGTHCAGAAAVVFAEYGDIQAWLESRAVDGHRANSRLLKRALRLERKDDLTTVLAVNAATITDNYWVKPLDDEALRYDDVPFG